MSDKPIIQADFVKPNLVPSRKVLQLIFEVPEEAADHAMAVLGGIPQSGHNQWCAIARLADTAKAQETQPAVDRVKGGARAKRAGILCGDTAFQQWLLQSWPEHWGVLATSDNMISDDDISARLVRWLCGVRESRAELDDPKKEDCGFAWDQIDRDYRASQEGRNESDQILQRDSGP